MPLEQRYTTITITSKMEAYRCAFCKRHSWYSPIRCGKCQKTCYCSKKCQDLDKKVHEEDCNQDP